MPCRQFYYSSTNINHQGNELQLRHKDRNKQQDGYWHLNLSCIGLQTVHSKTFAVNGPIESVILNNNRLTDLPDELAQLKDSLVRLELSGNNFTTLPKIIISLSRLETLQFSYNQLHHFPTSLLHLHHLTTLHLSGNFLRQVPSAISQMVGLRRLYLDRNRIQQIDQEFGKLTQLEILHLQGNNIRYLPTSLADLQALIELDCSDNPLIQPPSEICCQGVEVVRSYIRNQQMNDSNSYPKSAQGTEDIPKKENFHLDSFNKLENGKGNQCDRKKSPIITCGLTNQGKMLDFLRNSTLTSDEEGIQPDQCKTPNSVNGENRRQQAYDHAGSNSANRPSGKMRLRPWLEEKITAQAIPGLCWMDKENKIFRIPWKHAARQGWSVDEDASLFRAWAIHTGKFSPDRDEPKPKVWKANFRCALNSLHDVEQITEDSITKGNDAVKVYRFLDGGKRKGDLSDPIYKNVLKKLRCEEASVMGGQDLSIMKDGGFDISASNDLTTCKLDESITIDSKGGCFFFEDNGVCIRVSQNAIPDRITVSCKVVVDTFYQRQDDETVLGNILSFGLPMTRFAEAVTLCLPHQGFINHEKQEIIIKYSSEADKKWHECELVDVSELARRTLPVNKQQLFTSYAGCKTTSLTSFVVISRTRISRASFSSAGGRLSSHYSKDVYVQVPEKTFSSVTELMLQVSPIENDVANVWVSQESRISPFVTLKCNKSSLTCPVTLSIPFTTECLNDTAFAASALICLSLQQSPTAVGKDSDKARDKDRSTDSIDLNDSSRTPITKKSTSGETESKGNLKIFCKKLKESDWQEITDEVKPSMKLLSDSISFETRKQATYLIAFTKNSKDLTYNSVKAMFNRVCIPLVRMSVLYREMNNSYQIFVLCSSDSVIREVTQDFEKKMSAKCIYNSNLLKMAYGEPCKISFRGNLKPATGNKNDDFKLVYRPNQLQIKQFGLACLDVSHPLNGSIAFESYSNQTLRTLWSCEISFNSTVPSATKSSVTTASIPIISGPSKSSAETKSVWPAFPTPAFNVDPSRVDNHPTWPIYVQPYPHLTIPASTTGGSVTAPALNLNSPLMQSQSLTLIQQNHTAYGVHTPLLLPTHTYPQLNYNPTLVNMPQSLLHHPMLPSIANDSLQYQSPFAGLMPLPYAALQRPMLSIGMPSPELFSEKVWPEVAKRLSGRWRDLATGLNISESHIDQVDKSCLNSEDKVNKIIYIWRQQTSGLPAEKVQDEFQQAIKKCGFQMSELN